MLHQHGQTNVPPPEIYEDDSGIDLEYLIGAGRRQARVIIAGCLIGLALGLAFIITAVPRYTASSNVLIDNKDLRVAQQVSGVTEVTIDPGAVESELVLIQSERIGLAVVEKLDLSNNPTFMASDGSLLAIALGTVRSALDVSSWFQDDIEDDPAVIEARKHAALGKLRDNLGVMRIGRTYVIDIQYTSTSPDLAHKIADAYSAVYINDSLESNYDSTRRASDWLQNRVLELKQKSIEAELAVKKFRNDNNLIGDQTALFSDQQLAGLNSELIIARTESGKAKARLDQITAIIQAGATDALVPEALGSSIITEFRGKFLETSKRLAEIGKKLGPKHAQVVRLRNEMAEYERLMFDELRRIAEVQSSEYAIAKRREVSLQEEIARLANSSTETNQTLAQLRDLERQAVTFKSLHETLLKRHQEALHQQSFPISGARVITRAERPASPSYPKKMRSLILALFLGGAAGVGFAALNEYRDRVFRTGEQVRTELGIEFIGILPLVASGFIGQGASAVKKALKGVLKGGEQEAGPPQVELQTPMMRHVLDSPFSGYAETLRSAKIAADLVLPDKKTKIIGIASLLPAEGKSTTAKNLASLIANQGGKTLLIDGDLRNPGLSRAVAKSRKVGLIEGILQERPLNELVVTEPDSGLIVLPTVHHRHISHTSDMIASPGMRAILNKAEEVFDYIIIDLPPLGPVVDVRAALSLIDTVLFVIEWGRTDRKLVRDTLHYDQRLRDKALGAVLNKVDQEKIKTYEGYYSKDYYYSRYRNYYRDK